MFNTLRKNEDPDLLLLVILAGAGTFATIFAATAFLLGLVTRVAGIVSSISASVPDRGT